MPEHSDDLKLLNDCISAKKEAWDTFVNRFSKLIYYSINKTLRLHNQNLQQEDVEDVYSSVFVSFMDKDCKKLRQFEGRQGCTLSSWVRLITIRHTIDYLRSLKEHISLNDDSGGTQPMIERLPDKNTSFEKELEDHEAARTLKDAIDSLNPQDRLFMELFYEKELPPEEIAEIMNVSVNTVYSKKNRVREKIKKILSDRGIIARNPG
jgi:RNA polymerase sigma-70 factor (ECF subfamily)